MRGMKGVGCESAREGDVNEARPPAGRRLRHANC